VNESVTVVGDGTFTKMETLTADAMGNATGSVDVTVASGSGPHTLIASATSPTVQIDGLPRTLEPIDCGGTTPPLPCREAPSRSTKRQTAT
jgi:hypothetical protein